MPHAYVAQVAKLGPLVALHHGIGKMPRKAVVMETISTVDSTSSPKISLLANGRVDVVAQLPPTLERRRQLESFRVVPVRSSAATP